MINVLLADPQSDKEKGIWEDLKPPGFSVSFGEGQDERMLTQIREANCLVTRLHPVGGPLLAEAPRLKCVVRQGTNEHNLDLDFCRQRSLPVLDVPLRGRIAVAEHVFALLLALVKKVTWAHESVKQSYYHARGIKPVLTTETRFAFNWSGLSLGELFALKIGIVGFGEVGRQVALRAAAFGMKVLYYDEEVSVSFARSVGAEYRDLAVLLRESDVVTLHLPHTAQTEKTIGAAELGLMKETALLINTCRGGVVDEQALCRALAEGGIAGAGLDVFEYEPLPHNSSLLTMSNVVLTPHISSASTGGRRGDITDAWNVIKRVDWGSGARNEGGVSG